MPEGITTNYFPPKQYNIPSSVPTTNFPFAMAGEAVMDEPVSNCQTTLPELKSSA
jgi:hypothetical protein